VRTAYYNDVVVRPLRKFNDSRGWLSELFRHEELAEEEGLRRTIEWYENKVVAPARVSQRLPD